MACSIARTWAVIGEPWTPLILGDLAIGLRRFDQLRTDLGIAPNVLTDRLHTLEEAGVVERVPYKDAGRTRHEYHLTAMGDDLVPVLVAITNWGDRWLSDNTPPALFRHDDCGAAGVQARIVCNECGGNLTAHNTTAQPGPGKHAGPGTHIIGTVEANA